MKSDDQYIEIILSTQTLLLKSGDKLIREYPVSTALNGPGEKQGSECTPRGRHIVTEKIGDGCQAGTVFVGRVNTGEFYSPQRGKEFPDRDWILTRILRLSGVETGFNQGGDVDSYDRYIYIHGSPDEVEIGKPGSHGCIRMRNEDIIELFDQIEVGIPVSINEYPD